jgi:thymidine kinase
MDQEKRTFPRELLSRSKEERFNYFKNKVLGHDRLLDIHEQLMRALLYPTGASLILVYGPTGVGKTTLHTRIVQSLLKLEMEAMQNDPGYLPLVSMEAIAASRSYDWREHIIRVLIAANEPLISNKIDPQARKLSQGRDLARSVKDTELVLRRSLESCLHQRHTKYVIVDEAQHLKRVLTETDEQLVEVRTFLNKVPGPSSKRKVKGDEGGVETRTDTPGEQKQDGTRPESEEPAAPKPKKNRRPGERLPKRDPTGRRKNASNEDTST